MMFIRVNENSRVVQTLVIQSDTPKIIEGMYLIEDTSLIDKINKSQNCRAIIKGNKVLDIEIIKTVEEYEEEQKLKPKALTQMEKLQLQVLDMQEYIVNMEMEDLLKEGGIDNDL